MKLDSYDRVSYNGTTGKNYQDNIKHKKRNKDLLLIDRTIRDLSSTISLSQSKFFEIRSELFGSTHKITVLRDLYSKLRFFLYKL